MKLVIAIILQLVVIGGLALDRFAMPTINLPHIYFSEELRTAKAGDTLLVFNDGQTENVSVYHYGYVMGLNDHLAIRGTSIGPDDPIFHTTMHLIDGNIGIVRYHRRPRILNFLYSKDNRYIRPNDDSTTMPRDSILKYYKPVTQTNNTGNVKTQR